MTRANGKKAGQKIIQGVKKNRERSGLLKAR
jgi:hypothetical protein